VDDVLIHKTGIENAAVSLTCEAAVFLLQADWQALAGPKRLTDAQNPYNDMKKHGRGTMPIA
jgi:hypothetical protein